MQFEFQREEDGEYRTVGTAEGSGTQAVDKALDLLTQARGGSLPSGAYRVRPKDDPNADWLPFTLPTDNPISPA